MGTVYAQTVPVPIGPQLFVGSREYLFGNVSEGTKVKHSFELENRGSADLIIQKVISECGCTTSRAEPMLIPPQQKGVLWAEFDTSGFVGKRSKEVRVLTNDPNQSTVVFSIKGTVLEDVQVSPAEIQFGRVVQGSGASVAKREVSIKARSGADVSLGVVRAYSKFIIIQETERTPRSLRLLVSLAQDAPRGAFNERLALQVRKGKETRYLSIPLRADISGAIEISPPAVSFGLVNVQTPIERSVKIVNHGSERLQFNTISSSLPAITTRLVEVVPGRNYVLKVVLDPKLLEKTDEFKGLLTLVRPEETVLINVYGFFPPPQ